MRLIHRTTPAIIDTKDGSPSHYVAALETPVIGGVPQGILVRGMDTRNPGLLILHGGPGGAYIGCARAWFGDLESRWVVVNWDMRGAGLSFSREVPADSLTGGQLAQDALQVQEWVRSRFGVDRWILAAHSFGTLVAPFVLRQGPDRFEGYMAISPAPTDSAAEAESYSWTLSRAQEGRNRRAVRDLERIGHPPYGSGFRGLDVRARWTDRLGGAIEGATGSDIVFRAMRRGTEYTWGDLFRRFLPGVRFWMRNLDESLGPDSTEANSWDLPVPLLVVSGSVDWMAPLAASRRSFERAQAPRKQFIELPGLGHYPFVQDPRGFANALENLRPSS